MTEFTNNIEDYAENAIGSSAEKSSSSKADKVPNESENAIMLRGN